MAQETHIHEDFHRPHAVKGSSDRTFGFVFAAVFLVVALWPLRPDPSVVSAVNWWALAIAIGLLAVAVGRPRLLAPANRHWLQFGLLLQRIVNPLVMAVLFFAVVTPFAVAMRLAGKDPMRRKSDSAAATYWLERERAPAHSSMNNQF